MKWFASLSVVVFATSLASPIAMSEERNSELPVYKLKINAPNVEELHNRYLSIVNETVGVFNGGGPEDALQFYTVEGIDSGYFEFHTYPIGFVDHALALVGSNGLMSFKDLVMAGNTRPGPTTMWREFTMGGIDPSSGDKIPAVSCQSHNRSLWVAYPRGMRNWEVKWYDGRAITTANYMRIGLIYEPANTPHANPTDA